MSRNALKWLIGLVISLYPLAVYWAHGSWTPARLAGLLLLAGGLRMAIGAAWSAHAASWWCLATGLGGAGVVLLVLEPALPLRWFRFYPALLDLGVCALFFGSLFTRQPLVERFARLSYRGRPLPAAAIAYTRRVTQLWAASMLLIALVAVYTATQTSLELWSLFNGLLVYFVMGLIFLLEYAVRCNMRRKWGLT